MNGQFDLGRGVVVESGVATFHLVPGLGNEVVQLLVRGEAQCEVKVDAAQVGVAVLVVQLEDLVLVEVCEVLTFQAGVKEVLPKRDELVG